MKTQTRRKTFAFFLAFVMVMTVFTGCGKDGDSSAESERSGSSSGEKTEKRSDFAQEKLDQDIEDGYLILVNKENYLPSDYVPDDLEPLKYYAEDRSPDARFLRKAAADHFHDMVEAALEEDIDIVSTTAYRSYAFQKSLYNSYVSSKGQAEADKVSARPGSSEHQTGLAADLSTSEIDFKNGSAFADTLAGKWIKLHSWEYGFIVRYPDGLEDVTGYTYEPWHVRYVGMVAAREIYQKDITLEEYIEENDISNVEIVEPQK